MKPIVSVIIALFIVPIGVFMRIEGEVPFTLMSTAGYILIYVGAYFYGSGLYRLLYKGEVVR